MKNKLIPFFQATLGVLAIAFTTAIAAQSGSQSDPYASKAYVDDAVNSLKALITTGDSTAEISSDSYKPVYVSLGQTIYGAEGTELILRAGKGKIVIDGVDGIVDASTGSNLKQGSVVTMNHILIVPRADGRGVNVTEAAWFLVKGDYTIK